MSRRPPRLLWAGAACLLDTSSGAAITARQMLRQLAAAGWEIAILGATVFDHANGTAGFGRQWPEVAARQGTALAVTDGGLEHRLLVTAGTARGDMTNAEEGSWFALYTDLLESFAPDVVFYYGGQPFDSLIAREARERGARTAFLLVNGNYHGTRWCRDVDLVLTDSAATAALYRERIGISVTAVGSFIDPAAVVAEGGPRDRLLVVNPIPAKGGFLVIALARWLAQHRPEIVLEVVEGRTGWSDMLARVALSGGGDLPPLPNVVVTPNTNDMRGVYGRARVLLALSLWWESGARVLGEAMLNGVPAVVTARGGSPEMIGGGGVVLHLPDRFHEEPYTALPEDAEIDQIGRTVAGLFEDQVLYQGLAAAALAAGREIHDLNRNTARLIAALRALL